MTKHLPFYILLCALFTFSQTSFAQAPNQMNYQAVARNSQGNILPQQAVGLRFTIYDSIAGGNVLYRETQTDTTNKLGLFSVAIGAGTPVTGDFASIPWATNNKFLGVELDAAGGSNYVTMGISQLLSVPYAQYAASANISLTTQKFSGVSLYSTVRNAYQYSLDSFTVNASGTYMIIFNARGFNNNYYTIPTPNQDGLNNTNVYDVTTSQFLTNDFPFFVFYTDQAPNFSYTRFAGINGSTTSIRTLTAGDVIKIAARLQADGTPSTETWGLNYYEVTLLKLSN